MATDNLNSVLSNVKPSIVTPHLAEIATLTSEQKLRQISKIIIKTMVENFNKSKDAKNPRVVMHEGQAIEVRYLDITDLYVGVWPSISLMLLQLSLGEQMILIESLYPKATQLAAKKFAVTFTNIAKHKSNLELKSDPAIIDKLDSTLAGIAMLLAQMEDGGYPKPHPDKISKQEQLIQQIIKEKRRAFKHKQKLERAKERDRYHDQLGR